MDIFLVAARLILAAILGAIIGVEREIKNRAAGFRTHIIVSVGACLIVLIGIDDIGKFSSGTSRDTARTAGQATSGIDFLGAGTILRKKDTVAGLTTTTTLWLSAAIGLAVGIGYYEGTIIVTVICLVILISLNKIGDLINRKTMKSYLMIFDIYNFNQDSFYEFTSKKGVEVRRLDVIDEEMDGRSMIGVTFFFNRNYDTDGFFKRLESEYNFQSVKSIDDEG